MRTLPERGEQRRTVSLGCVDARAVGSRVAQRLCDSSDAVDTQLAGRDQLDAYVVGALRGAHDVGGPRRRRECHSEPNLDAVLLESAHQAVATLDRESRRRRDHADLRGADLLRNERRAHRRTRDTAVRTALAE